MRKDFYRIYLILIVAFSQIAATGKAQNSLDSFIDLAMSNSPLLKEYQNQEVQNQIDSLKLKAGFGWQVNANSYNMYAPVVKGWGYDNAVTNGANLSAILSFSKEITGFRNRQNQFNAIELQNRSLKNAFRISRTELKKEVSSLYVEAFGSWEQYTFEKDMLQFMTKQKDVIKRLTETGIARQTDFLAFMVSLQQQELKVDEAKNQYSNNLALLRYACGVKDTLLIEISDPLLPVNDNVKLFQTPFYHQFVIDSLKLVNTDRQVDLSYQPKISLVVDGGYLSSLVVQPYKNFGVSAGISVSVPLYDGGQRKMQHKRIAMDLLSELGYRDFYTNQYFQKTSQLRRQLEIRKQLETKIIKQIDYAQTLVEANHAQLNKGEVQITEYLIAIGNYMSAKKMLTQNTLEKNRIIVELNYWNCPK